MKSLTEKAALFDELVGALTGLRLALEKDKYHSWEMGVPRIQEAESFADDVLARCASIEDRHGN